MKSFLVRNGKHNARQRLVQNKTETKHRVENRMPDKLQIGGKWWDKKTQEFEAHNLHEILLKFEKKCQ